MADLSTPARRGAGAGVVVRVLGGFEVTVDDVPVGPGPDAGKPRALLTLLVLQANRPVAKERLVEDLWVAPPASAVNLVEKYVSLWRKALGADRLRTVGRGYEVRLDRHECDLLELLSALSEGDRLVRAGEHRAAVAAFDAARALWRGGDVEHEAATALPAAHAQYLVDLHLRTVEGWAAAALTGGVDVDVVEPLRRAGTRHPFRERLTELLLWAHYRRGEQAEAVAAYTRTRDALAEGLGQDPGTALRDMYTRVLRHDPALRGTVTAAGTGFVPNLPPRGRRFVGRRQQLTELRALLGGPDRPGLRSVAIWGPVGVGKTALAVEYAGRHHDDYDLRWFVNAGSRTSVADGLEALAQRLGVELPPEREQYLHLLWAAMERFPRRLLVLDGAPRPADVLPFWPTLPHGDIIVTSMNPDWGHYAHLLELPVLTRTETMHILHDGPQSRGDPPEAFPGPVQELAYHLDGLPLACEQATAYMRQTGMTVTEYVRLFERRRAHLLARGTPHDHRGTLDTTWRLVRAELAETAPAAVPLLELCAHLAPDDVPLWLLRSPDLPLPDPLARTLRDELDLEDALRAVRRFSLLTRVGDRVRMHRLLQAVIVAGLPDDEHRRWRGRVVALLSAAAPASATDAADWPHWQLLVPHLTQVTATLDTADLAGADGARLVAVLHRTSEYLVARESFTDGRDLLWRLLLVLESQQGDDHDLTVASTLTLLGEVLERSGEYRQALGGYERALELLRRHHPPDHASHARTASGLARVLTCHGGATLWRPEDLPGAEDSFHRALDLLAVQLGPQHPVVAQTLAGLGQVRQDRGDLTAAVECLERSLTMLEHAYGDRHPDVGHALDKLGYALGRSGDLAAARARHEQAHDVLSATYGEGHAETGWSLSNLGMVLLDAGDVARALDVQTRAHVVFRDALGPAVATHLVAWRLARTLLSAGRPADGLRLLGATVPLLRAELGAAHPDVVRAEAELQQATSAGGPGAGGVTGIPSAIES